MSSDNMGCQTFNLHLWSAVKQSAIRWGMPALHTSATVSLTYICFVWVCILFLLSRWWEDCSDTRGLEIAIKQRVDDALTSKLPMFYLVNRPHISLVPSAYPFQTNLEYKFLSLNWAQGDISLEIVDGLSGKITERLALLISSNVTYYLSKRMYFEYNL